MIFSVDQKQIFKSIVQCQSELKSIAYDSSNPHFKNKYVSLPAIQDFIRPILYKHKLAVLQSIEVLDDKFLVQTILAHESGEMISFNSPLIVSQNTMQGLGSAITYAKRYALSSILNISGDEDDDANLASSSKNIQSKQSEQKQTLPDNPLDFVLNLGTIKNKKLGEIDEAKLRDVGNWLSAEIKKAPKAPKSRFYGVAYGQIKKALKVFEDQAKPKDAPPDDFDMQNFAPDDSSQDVKNPFEELES